MKRAIALCGAILVCGCGVGQTATTSSRSDRLTLESVHCHARDGGLLPDPNCTPGEIDPSVNQEDIRNTICVSGYTRKVRPPESYTEKLKKQQISQYGYADKQMSDYEEDHLISLELGGSPSDTRNLWPEFHPSPNPKDRVENMLHRFVCDGKMTLATAQHEITSNWTLVYRRFFGVNPQ